MLITPKQIEKLDQVINHSVGHRNIRVELIQYDKDIIVLHKFHYPNNPSIVYDKRYYWSTIFNTWINENGYIVSA